MSQKIFKESDSWGDSSGNSGELSWSFKKPQKQKISNKEKRAKKRNHSDVEEDSEAGKYVRAPKYYDLEESDGHQDETTTISKKNKGKRKHNSVENHSEQSSDGITPEKKSKKQNGSSSAANESQTSFADKLRENLKGSRFRFLNEQMYKQSSKESKEIFKEDETAFEAYHEGYRHQVAQWPMNPLDRIIKNLKRL